MTDQWVPAPPVVPPPPSDPLPPANSWNPTPPCTSGDNPSIVDGVVITGVPATISAPYAWSITLNDGNSPANFSLNRNDSSNNLIDQPIQASGANGYVTFPNAIFVNGMQADGNLFINGVMQFSALENLQLPGGTAGQVLTASGTAGFLGWASPAIAADAPSNGNLYGRSNGAWQSGGVINGVLYVQGANSFALVAPAGNPTSIFGGKGQAPAANWRWQMQLGNSDAETGGNSGSNFSLSAISDGGSVLSTPFAINRATGAATLQGPTQILGPLGNTPTLGVVKGPSSGVAMIAGQALAGPPRWQMYLADFSAEIGNNLGSNFTLQNCSDAGAVLGTPLTIVRATGAATFGYGVTVTGALVGGNAQFTGQLVLNSGPSQFQLGGGAAGQFLATNGLGVLTWQDPPGAPGGAVPEAPQDGTSYARNDAAWAHLTSADITDWATQLANYLPLSGGTLSGALTINAGGLTVTAGTTQVASMIVNGTTLFMGTAPTLTSAPTAAMQVTNKGYVDGLAGTATPLMDGTAAVGVGTTWSRQDHVHPTDTSRYAASNPSGYQTAAQVAAVLPPASTVIPLTDGVGAVGTSAAYARADHVHPVVYMGDNRLINGDMRIDQRNAGASGTGVGYTVDRWAYSAAQSGKGAWQRVTGGAGIQVLGFGYVLQFISSSAYTPLASDNFCFYQMIEADMMADFAWGTAGAQPVTLSFIVNSSLTGTFGGVIRNQPGPPTRSYPFTFSIPVANTWTKIAITIPGDTAGAWVLQGNAAGLQLMFDLGSGATLRGPANAWAAANYFGANGTVSVVATNAAAFTLTGVKLEIGSVATPFNRQSPAKSMADCQRYYSSLNMSFWGNGSGTNPFGQSITLPMQMRTTPTIVFSGTSYNNANGITLSGATNNTANIYALILATGGGFCSTVFTASVEL